MPTSERCGHVLPESGFLVVKRATERYRGVDRGALAPFTSNDRSLTHSVPLAETRLVELLDREYCSVCDCGFVASEHDAIDVLGWAELEDPGVYEIIWARVLGAVGAPPDDYERLGFEPTWFWSDHFSAVQNTLFRRLWPPAGSWPRFREFANVLNAHGLFDDADTALAFREAYWSWENAEIGDFEIAEVWTSRT